MVRDEHSRADRAGAGGSWWGSRACSPGSPSAAWRPDPRPAAPVRGNSLDEMHQMYMVPSSYNFVESNKSYETQLISLIHDRLLHYDPVQNQLVAGLATTYEVSPDGLTWTFHLRDAQTPDWRSA